ncbi:MFS transporter [Nakamurella endophytica]|uniref:Major facilitator superfamily protein n=1 Tax=Nakamurella endophytica TaxID=1748367 RepID=A0A917SST3_9ACTN|nr:MFS transporter [Nakamurella endophytica]GGL96020.1 putative major facilitator superfamily protein [Nakamurella endophytica]
MTVLRGDTPDGRAASVAGHPWRMLGLGLGAQVVSATVVNGAAFLIPALQQQRGLSLATAGLVVALPTFGVMATLILWGALADAIGERVVLAAGLALTALALGGASLSRSLPVQAGCLLVAGMAAASSNAASGRVVIGWFPPHRRGLVMGIRQMAQPLGVGLAAVTLPQLAAAHGIRAALLLPTVLAAAAALGCALGVVDPPRPPRGQAPAGLTRNPYRHSSLLWRIHAVSVLLVVPQFLVWTFALVWLVGDRGWAPGPAGVLVTVAQLVGAAGRLGVGWWSDRWGSRMRPLRLVAVAAAVVMALLGLTDALDLSVSVVLLVVATAVTVADNGLAFTAVAEIGGPFWAGRALGAQNTAQFLAGSLVPPLVGAVVAGVGYPATFALSALLPVLAVPLVPRRDGG